LEPTEANLGIQAKLAPIVQKVRGSKYFFEFSKIGLARSVLERKLSARMQDILGEPDRWISASLNHVCHIYIYMYFIRMYSFVFCISLLTLEVLGITTNVDFFSLDVEGGELEVLQSIDWDKV